MGGKPIFSARADKFAWPRVRRLRVGVAGKTGILQTAMPSRTSFAICYCFVGLLSPSDGNLSSTWLDIPGTRWQTSADGLPVALGEVSTALVGRVIYVVGEGSRNTFSKDLESRGWVVEAPRPFYGSHHGTRPFRPTTIVRCPQSLNLFRPGPRTSLPKRTRMCFIFAPGRARHGFCSHALSNGHVLCAIFSANCR